MALYLKKISLAVFRKDEESKILARRLVRELL